MVPDGMGLADVTAARNYLSGEDGEGLSFEKFPQIGYQRTYAANSTVTDSAAASAWATGQKHDLSQISWRNRVPIQTILEIARKKNKSAGLVATSTITQSTPAAFGAHVKSRGIQDEIARQHVEETGVEVLLDGGRKHCESLIGASQKKYDYIYVDKTKDLKAVSKTGADKVLGLFSEGEKTQEKFRIDSESSYPDGEPTLAEMTSCALDILQKDNDGFFLLVEGSHKDWANHGNDYDVQLSEMLGFNEAVKEVCKWIEEKSDRGAETLS